MVCVVTERSERRFQVFSVVEVDFCLVQQLCASMQMKPGFYLTIKTIILKVSENNGPAPCFVVIERRFSISWVCVPCSLQSFLFFQKIVKRAGETENCLARIV